MRKWSVALFYTFGRFCMLHRRGFLCRQTMDREEFPKPHSDHCGLLFIVFCARRSPRGHRAAKQNVSALRKLPWRPLTPLSRLPPHYFACCFMPGQFRILSPPPPDGGACGLMVSVLVSVFPLINESVAFG